MKKQLTVLVVGLSIMSFALYLPEIVHSTKGLFGPKFKVGDCMSFNRSGSDLERWEYPQRTLIWKILEVGKKNYRAISCLADIDCPKFDGIKDKPFRNDEFYKKVECPK